MEEKMVTITQKEYDELCERDIWLGALECAGVDNWEGYSVAKDYLAEWEEEDEEEN